MLRLNNTNNNKNNNNNNGMYGLIYIFCKSHNIFQIMFLDPEFLWVKCCSSFSNMLLFSRVQLLGPCPTPKLEDQLYLWIY